MAGLHFEFVSPETVLFSGDVDQVDLPGMEGDLGVLPGHAPMVTTLRPGIITIFRDGNREPVVVVGGFAEMSPAGLTVLADRIKDAEEDIADCRDDAQRDKLNRHLDQLRALQVALTQ